MTEKSEGAVKKSPANDFCLIGWAKNFSAKKKEGFFRLLEDRLLEDRLLNF